MKKYTLLFTILLLTFSCSEEQYKRISEIPEASWICYMQESETFFVANDEWSIFQINKKWKILKNKKVWKYDFEWIYCKNNDIYILEEDSWNISKIGFKKLDIIETYTIDLKKEKRDKYFNKKSWWEWLAYDWKYFYISTQGKKNNLLKFSLNKNKLKLEKKYDINLNDLSWLTILNNILYILSDKNDLILKFDLKTEKITQKIKLKKWHWEWISFDDKWNMYLSDDDWFIVKI